MSTPVPPPTANCPTWNFGGETADMVATVGADESGDDGASSRLSSPPQDIFEDSQKDNGTAKADDVPTIMDQLEEMELALHHGGAKRKRGPQDSITAEEGTQEGDDRKEAPPAKKATGSPPAPQTTSRKRKSPKNQKAAKAAATKKAKTIAKQWQAPFVFEDSKSPLAQADLRVRSTRETFQMSSTLSSNAHNRRYCCTPKPGMFLLGRNRNTSLPSSQMIPTLWIPAPRRHGQT